MKRIRFNIPTVDGVETREGYRVWLRYGNLRRAFVLQLEGDRPRILADYASGYRLTDLSDAMLQRYVAYPAAYNNRFADWRWAAQRWLHQAALRKGHAAVHAMLTSVPVINGRA